MVSFLAIGELIMQDCWYKELTSESEFKWVKGMFHGWGTGSNYQGHPSPVAIIEPEDQDGKLITVAVEQVQFQTDRP